MDDVMLNLFWLIPAIIGIGIFTLIVLLIIFWIKMIINCANRNFLNPNDKIVWILVIVLLQLLGAIIYWFVVASKPESK